MTAAPPASRVQTPRVTVCAYPECREPIPDARPGQRFCRAPKKCRQLDHRRRLREHEHRCQCGEVHKIVRRHKRQCAPDCFCQEGKP